VPLKWAQGFTSPEFEKKKYTCLRKRRKILVNIAIELIQEHSRTKQATKNKR
jgi:hypothetical protein